MAWPATWPAVYERLLARLQTERSDGQGIREFIRILRLHEDYPAQQVEEAVTRALEHGCLQADGVLLCLRQLTHPEPSLATLDLRGHQRLGQDLAPPDLQRYEQLLVAGRR